MRVQVVRSGGVAGIRHEAMADTTKLAKKDAKTLERLVIKAELEELPPPVPQADAFVYDIVIDGDNGGAKIYRTGDAMLPDHARELIDWVLERESR